MRTFKENFIVGYAGKYLMLNLISFRRKLISKEEYLMLQSINNKNYTSLTDNENFFIESLHNEKQLLSNDLIDWYDKQKALLLPKPIYKIDSVTLNLTYDCNFHCDYCYQKNFNLSGLYMSNSDIDIIYNYIKDYNSNHGYSDSVAEVVISGGESLLDKNINTINYICNKFSKSSLKLFTNGVNILKNINKINFAKFKEIQISLDGTDDVIRILNHNSNELFNTIIQGILYLDDLGIKIDIITMVTKETIHYFDEYLNLLKKYEINKSDNINVRFSFVIDYAEKYSLKSSFYSIDEYLVLRRQIVNLINEKGLSKNISVDRLYDLSYLENAIYRKQNEQIDGRASMCKTYKGIPLLFSPDHNIYWCTCTNPNRILEKVENGPLALDNSPLLQKLMNRNIYNMVKCKNCIYRYICSSGCPLYPLHTDNDVSIEHCGIFNSSDFEQRAELYLSV